MPTYPGSASNDTIIAGGNADLINGLAGNDFLYGGGGRDTIYGGDNNDFIDGGSANDSVDGGNGNDTIDGGTGNDTLLGGAGDDTFLLTGTFGNDVITGGETAEVLGDRIDASALTVGVTVAFTGSEAGSVTDGTSRTTFTQVENFTLTAQADTLDASNASLPVNADGGAGNDLLTGGTGADTLMGGLGADTINAGAGNDLVTDEGQTAGTGSADVINLGAGDDTYQGTGTGNADNDLIYGGDGNDAITTSGGKDTVFGGTGNDSITLGNDTLASNGDQAFGEVGNDTILGGNTDDTIDGGLGADSLTGNGGNDVIYGGTGASAGTTYILNGTFDAGSANWTGTDLELGNTESAYLGNGSTNKVAEVDGNTGPITVMQQSFAVTGAQSAQLSLRSVLRTDGTLGIDGFKADVLDSTGAVISTMTILPTSKTAWANYTLNFTFPAAGTYTLRFTEVGNNDSLGAIIDAVQITSTSAVDDLSPDTISGGDGNDALYGMAGNDLVSGDAGADSLFGGVGDDSLYGGTEADTLSGDAGNDLLYGGEGNDQLSGGADSDTLYGDAGNDSLTGDAGADSLFGGVGDDSLYGGTEADTLSGDAGNDALYGGQGADSLDGGDGNDLLDGGTEADTLSGGADSDSLYGGAGDDALYGGLGNDVLDGGDGVNILSGGAGDDTIFGNANDEYFAVEDGNDVLYGGAGNDTFQGGIGDTVNGGVGFNDRLDLSDWRWAGTDIHYSANDTQSGTVDFLDSQGHIVGSMAFSNIEKVLLCLTPGSLIATAQGEVAVEDLVVGDLVQTMDHGLQELRWVGRRSLSMADLIVEPRLRPVRIAAGALGAGRPERDMMVSPQHRMLVEGARAEMLFGERQVLVAATHLTGLPDVAPAFPYGVTYIHLLFDRHELIRADGTWTESFQPASRSLQDMDLAQRAEIELLFPDLSGNLSTMPRGFAAARPTLKAHEVRVLLAD